MDLTHAMAISLGVVLLVVVVARPVMNAVVLVLMEMVVKAMVLNLMKVVMVMVGMFEYRCVSFNTSRVILEAERLDLVDPPTSLSIWPWSLHFPLPQLDS